MRRARALTRARRGRSVLSLERFPPRAGAHFALEALPLPPPSPSY